MTEEASRSVPFDVPQTLSCIGYETIDGRELTAPSAKVYNMGVRRPEAATAPNLMASAKFRTASQVIESFRTHGKVKVERVGKGLYGIFAKGNPEWSCMARYSRTELLYWANRF